MVGFIARRAASAFVVLWLVASATFFLVEAAPGAPAALFQNPRVSPSSQRLLARALDLDRGIAHRYLLWLGAAARGDWGTSFTYGRPVSSVLREHLPATAALGFAALLVALLVGAPLGLGAGQRPGSKADLLVQTLAIAWHSAPQFWLALMAMLLFAHWIPLFPAGHLRSVGAESLSAGARAIDLLHHLTLPATVLGLSIAGSVCRLVRAKVIMLRDEKFVTAARAKGLPERRILFVHLLPLALTSIIQLFGVALPIVCGGVLVTEVVFSWPGLGRAAFLAVQSRDYPLVVGSTVLTTVAVVMGSFLADTIEAAVDPRLRHPPLR